MLKQIQVAASVGMYTILKVSERVGIKGADTDTSIEKKDKQCF